MNSVAPGVVIFRNKLSQQQQEELCRLVMAYGKNPDYSFTKENGEYNSARMRGRIYTSIVDDELKTIEEFQPFSEICKEFTEEAHLLDPSVRPYTPTHLLMLLYVGNRGMGYHKDNGKNDGDEDYPIVSFSIGNSCDFAMKFDGWYGKETVIKLRSGDAILFGGQNRMVSHSVKKVHDDCPIGLKNIIKQMARINLTFRYVPSVIGMENNFKYFDAQKVSQENRKKKFSNKK